jgi:hypothetical protein
MNRPFRESATLNKLIVVLESPAPRIALKLWHPLFQNDNVRPFVKRPAQVQQAIQSLENWRGKKVVVCTKHLVL